MSSLVLSKSDRKRGGFRGKGWFSDAFDFIPGAKSGLDKLWNALPGTDSRLVQNLVGEDSLIGKIGKPIAKIGVPLAGLALAASLAGLTGPDEKEKDEMEKRKDMKRQHDEVARQWLDRNKKDKEPWYAKHENRKMAKEIKRRSREEQMEEKAEMEMPREDERDDHLPMDIDTTYRQEEYIRNMYGKENPAKKITTINNHDYLGYIPIDLPRYDDLLTKTFPWPNNAEHWEKRGHMIRAHRRNPFQKDKLFKELRQKVVGGRPDYAYNQMALKAVDSKAKHLGNRNLSVPGSSRQLPLGVVDNINSFLYPAPLRKVAKQGKGAAKRKQIKRK
jgi:hypothetical protein